MALNRVPGGLSSLHGNYPFRIFNTGEVDKNSLKDVLRLSPQASFHDSALNEPVINQHFSERYK